MDDTQAKQYGDYIISIGMPWALGLLDGGNETRIGENLRCPSCFPYENDVHSYGPGSWPDLRDSVTAGFFISWAISKMSNAGCAVWEFSGNGVFGVHVVFNRTIREFESDSRVGAWIEATKDLCEI